MKEQKNNPAFQKQTWKKPVLRNFGKVQDITQGSPNPSNKRLGLIDDILNQSNPGLSTVP
jgi:hypothetical protein